MKTPIAVVCSLAVLAGFAIIANPTSASAAASASSVPVDLAAPEQFIDGDGQPLTITSDSGQESNTRIVRGTTSDGTPFETTLYSGLPVASSDDKDAPLTGSVSVQTIVASTPSGISVAWAAQEDATAFDLELNGVSQGSSAQGNYQVGDLQPGTSYSLTLTATSPAKEINEHRFDTDTWYANEKAKLEADAGLAPAPSSSPTVEPEPGEPSSSTTEAPTTALAPAYTSTQTLSVKTQDALQVNAKSRKLAAPGSTIVDSTDLRYRTFIPWQTIADGGDDLDNNIAGLCIYGYELQETKNIDEAEQNAANETFAGDDRTFQQPTAQDDHPFRTEVAVNIDWQDTAVDVASEPGYTRVVNKQTGEERAVRRANMDGVKWADSGVNLGYVRVDVNHIANDPFCPALFSIGAISWRMTTDFYDSGLVRATGWQFTMPSHEAWVTWNGATNWTPILKSNATHLVCLLEGTGEYYFGALDDEPSATPTACIQRISTQTNRSTDKWADVNGSFGITKAGWVWGTGSAALLAPYGGGDNQCTVQDFVSPFILSGLKSPKLLSTYGSGAIVDEGNLYEWGGQYYSWQDDPNGYPVSDALTIDGWYGTMYDVNAAGDIVAKGQNPDYVNRSYSKDPYYFDDWTAFTSGQSFKAVSAYQGLVVALGTDGKVWHRVNDDSWDGLPDGHYHHYRWEPYDTGSVTFDSLSTGSRTWALSGDTLWSFTDYDSPTEEVTLSDPHDLKVALSGISVQDGRDLLVWDAGVHWADASVNTIEAPTLYGSWANSRDYIASTGDWYTYDPDTGSFTNLGTPPVKNVSVDEARTICWINE